MDAPDFGSRAARLSATNIKYSADEGSYDIELTAREVVDGGGVDLLHQWSTTAAVSKGVSQRGFDDEQQHQELPTDHMTPEQRAQRGWGEARYRKDSMDEGGVWHGNTWSPGTGAIDATSTFFAAAAAASKCVDVCPAVCTSSRS